MPGLDTRALLKLRELADQPVTELAEKLPAAYTVAREAAVATVRTTVDATLADAPAEVKDHFATVDLDAAVHDDGDVKTSLVEALGGAGLDQPAMADALERIEKIAAGTDGVDLVKPVAENPLLAGELRRAEVAFVGASAKLPAATLTRLTEDVEAMDRLDDETLDELVATKAIGEDEADRLAFAATVHNIVDDDDAVVKAAIAATGDRRSLAGLDAAGWEAVLKDAGAADDATVPQRAADLATRTAELMPTDAVLGRVLPKGATAVARDAMKLDAEGQQRFARTYPGLGIEAIVEDAGLTASQRTEKVAERLALLEKVADMNAGVEIMDLDLSGRSPEGLTLTGIPAKEKTAVLQTLTALQRADALGAGLAPEILAGGYTSAIQVARERPEALEKNTGLSEAKSREVRERARARAEDVMTSAGTMIDVQAGGFDDIAVANIPQADLDEFLKSFEGYSVMFGSQANCRCEHCQSILSPAAYFVDLMVFIEQHVTAPTFAGRPGHPLKLRNRRPDLWTLPLTCENTNTLVPTLDIINPILENHIARHHSASVDLANRTAVEDLVYRQKLATVVSSFGGPFLLPLVQLDVLLELFEVTRADVLRALGRDPDALAAATLQLSAKQVDVITTPAASKAAVQRVYDMTFTVTSGKIAPFDAQLLLKPVAVKRPELGELLDTRFVDAQSKIDIKGEKLSSDSVQNDVERVHGLTLSAADRLHRFARVWRAAPWTIGELDLALERLGATELTVPVLGQLARLRDVQKALGASWEETLAMAGDLMTRGPGGRPALVDRLFNMPAFAPTTADRLPQPSTAFIHPALKASPTAADRRMQNRLVAALGIGDDDLLRLIVELAPALGADPDAATESARGFGLSIRALTLLYRHARLAARLRLSAADLFTLIRLTGLTGGHVTDAAGAVALIEAHRRLTLGARRLDDLAVVTGLAPQDPSRYPDAAAMATEIVDEVRSRKLLAFADTALAFVPGVTEGQSRAIIAANAARIERVPGGSDFRLARGFDPDAPLTLPAGVTVAEPDLRARLVAHHPEQVLPLLLAARLKQPLDKVEALLALAGIDLRAGAVFDALWATAGPGALEALVDRLAPLVVLLGNEVFDAETVDFVRGHLGLFAITDVTAPTVAAVHRADAYAAVLRELGADRDEDDPLDPADVRAVLAAHTTAAGFGPADDAQLGRILGLAPAVAAAAPASFTLPGDAIEALLVLARGVRRAAALGVTVEGLADIASSDPARLAAGVSALTAALRVRFPTEQDWERNVEPLEDRIRSRRRDALVDYLIFAVHPEFTTRSELYQHFLIDVELEGCARTTRVAAAMSSAQLYVHRVRMNLEQSGGTPGTAQHVHALPSSVPADEWAWRRNYRVWEANRKVFLWPENYIEPGLRDDKTPLFEQLEEELLQKEIDDQNVLDAYSTYVRGFEEVATLRIAGAYHETGYTASDGETDVLHLFATAPGDPPTYYYRTVKNLATEARGQARGVVWSPWRQIGVQIPVRNVAPVVYRGRLYVFWAEYTTRSFNTVSGGSSTFAGYRHRMAVKFTTLRLDGKWTPPQDVELAGSPFYTEAGRIYDGLQANHRVRFSPYAHTEPMEDYRPVGPNWERLVVEPPRINFDRWPVVIGRNFHLFAEANTHRRKLESNDSPWAGTPGDTIPFLCAKPSSGTGRGLYYGYPRWWRTTANGMAALVLDDRRITEFDAEWNGSLRVSEGLYVGKLCDLPAPHELSSVAGAVEDAILQTDGDAVLIQGTALDGAYYRVRRLASTLGDELSERLFMDGVDGLLDTDYQLGLSEAPLPITGPSFRMTLDPDATELDYRGPYGTYYREIFFHVPFLIANHLNSQGRYAAAQRWYHYIFDPTAQGEQFYARSGEPDPEDVLRAARERVWRYRELRGLDVPRLRQILTDSEALERYRKDPFNPHAIARLRLSAYQKTIVMKYVDNLIDWGDSLFTQFTTESVNEATMLYIMAFDILGERPAELGSCGEEGVMPRTLEKIGPLVEEDSEILVELETWLVTEEKKRKKGGRGSSKRKVVDRASARGRRRAEGEHAKGTKATAGSGRTREKATVFDGESWRKTKIAGWGDEGRSRTGGKEDDRGVTREHAGGRDRGGKGWEVGYSIVRQITPVFCVPANKDLREYWDRVEDRLYKIRHCLDITGVRRQLAPFAPEIDPRLLVRARAAGLSLEDVLAATAGDLPPYRFAYLIERAKSYAGTLQSFGSALLGAIEKRDVEELTRLRLVHQQNLLKMSTKARRLELTIAERSIAQLTAQRDAAQYRVDYYDGLVTTGRTPWEITQSIARHTASGLNGGAALLRSVAGVMYLIPQLGSPFAMKYGGQELGNSVNTWSSVARDMAGVAEAVASSAGLEAGFERRVQGWEHQRDLARHEVGQFNHGLNAAELRRQIAERSLEVHERTIEQGEEILALYGDKFTDLDLYQWLSATLQRVYREAYNGAIAMARLAEQAYRFERDADAEPALRPNYWDTSRAGLLAGDQLMVDLQGLERRFIESNHRSLEIDQPFSLTQIDPAALIALRETGTCEFAIPEAYFDLAYPGQYRRRIKGVRVTIPAITGPYTNIGATLTLVASKVRNRPALGAGDLVDVPVQRVSTIATSTAQGDGGVFELSFRDERYMPFEGAGAVSRWRLTLPAAFRQFDYQTISDVVLNVSYTAQLDGAFRGQVEAQNAAVEGTLLQFLSGQSLVRVFSLRQDFSQVFTRLLHSPEDTAVPLEIAKAYFPPFLRGRTLQIDKVRLALRLAPGVSAAGVQLKVGNATQSGFTADASLGGLPAKTATAAFGSSLPVTRSLAIGEAAGLAPAAPAAGDQSAVDDGKLLDVLVIVEYRVA